MKKKTLIMLLILVASINFASCGKKEAETVIVEENPETEETDTNYEEDTETEEIEENPETETEAEFNIRFLISKSDKRNIYFRYSRSICIS